MKVSEFQKFIRVANLGSLDLGKSQVTFCPAPLRIYYEGMHIAATTRATDGLSVEGLVEPATVESELLLNSLKLFSEDEDLKASCSDTNLNLRASGRSLNLRRYKGTLMRADPPQKDLPAVVVDKGELLSAMNFLVDVTTRKVTLPVLTGVHAVASGGSLKLEATDSIRAALAEVPISTQGGEFNIVIPAIDLQAALTVLEGEEVRLRAHPGRSVGVMATDRSTIVRISLLAGVYPDLSRVTVQSDAPLLEFSIPRDLLETAIKAAQLLDSQRIVHLEFTDKGAFFQVKGAELGNFTLKAGGAREAAHLLFDADYLQSALNLKGPLALSCWTPKKPVRFAGEGGWQYWLAPLSL